MLNNGYALTNLILVHGLFDISDRKCCILSGPPCIALTPFWFWMDRNIYIIYNVVRYSEALLNPYIIRICFGVTLV